MPNSRGGKRRDNGDGSLYPRRNRAGKVIGYVGAYGVPSEAGTKRKTVYGKTREEAKALLAKAIADRNEGATQPGLREPELSVSEYLTSWLADCAF